jgi:hypothetical protein
LFARIKLKAPTGKFDVKFDRKVKTIEFTQKAQNENSWQTIDCGVVELKKGESPQLVVKFLSNNLEFNFLEFVEI